MFFLDRERESKKWIGHSDLLTAKDYALQRLIIFLHAQEKINYYYVALLRM